MIRTASRTPRLCPRFHRASELIGRRWTGAILYVLLQSPQRFAELKDAIPDITDRMLSERLHELEREGIVARTTRQASPVRVEYAVTEKGRALVVAIEAIASWAERFLEADAAEPPPLSAAGQG